MWAIAVDRISAVFAARATAKDCLGLWEGHDLLRFEDPFRKVSKRRVREVYNFRGAFLHVPSLHTVIRGLLLRSWNDLRLFAASFVIPSCLSPRPSIRLRVEEHPSHPSFIQRCEYIHGPAREPPQKLFDT